MSNVVDFRTRVKNAELVDGEDVKLNKATAEELSNRIVALDSQKTSLVEDLPEYEHAKKMHDSMVSLIVEGRSLSVIVGDYEEGEHPIFLRVSRGSVWRALKQGKIVYVDSAIAWDERPWNVMDGTVATADLYLSPSAFAQICAHSGAGSVQYMRKCLDKHLVELVAENLTTWLHTLSDDKDIMLRILGNQVVGVVSGKYTIFDHSEALEVLDKALQGADAHDSFVVEATSLTASNMYVRLIDPEKVVVSGPDGVKDTTAGLILRNGQTGQSAVSVEFMLYTFACSNGLIISDDRGMVYKRKHVGITHEELEKELTEVIRQFPDYVVAARESVAKAQATRLDIGDRELLKARLKRGLRTGDKVVGEIIDLMDLKYDNTKWGLVSAITEVAQKFNAERQYEFEKYAGDLLLAM